MSLSKNDDRFRGVYTSKLSPLSVSGLFIPGSSTNPRSAISDRVRREHLGNTPDTSNVE